MTATMKNIIKLFSVAVLGLGLVSCSDFLQEEVTTELGVQHCYSTEAALNADIYGCYKAFSGGGFMYGPFHEWTQPASGVVHWGKSNRIGDSNYMCMLDLYRRAAHPYTYWGFENFGQATYLANQLLGALEQSTAPEEIKKKFEGEGYYIRALCNFFMVRLYGDISFVDNPPKTIAEVCQPRRPFWECYNFILEDLTKAFELMPDYNEMIRMAGGNASGRVCNYGAKAMRSLVYLTIGSLLAHPNDNFWVNRTPEFKDPDGTPLDAKKAFEHALADAKDVIDNGPYELTPSFAQLFRWGGHDRNNPGQYPEDFQLKERIHVLPRTAEGIQNTALESWSLPPYYMGQSGSTASRVLITRWMFQKWCATYGGIKGTDEDNSNIYVDCGDPRMKASLVYGSFIGKNSEVKMMYPSTGFVQSTTSGTDNANYYSVYNIKYYDATYDNNVGHADLYVMRFAEVYLIAAEAAAYLDKTSEAISYINVLLKRARQSGDMVDGKVVINYAGNGNCTEPADWTASKFSSKEELLTAIFWERMFELNFECHEYFDTHRCGAQWMVDNICKPKNAFLDQPEQTTKWIKFFYGDGAGREAYNANAVGADGTFRYIEDATLMRKSLISGYPTDELQNNTELDPSVHDPYKGQNPVEVSWD